MKPSKTSSMGKWKEVKPRKTNNRRKTKRVDFNPSQDDICLAMQEYLANGGVIHRTDCDCLTLFIQPEDNSLVDDFLHTGWNGTKALSRSYEQFILRIMHES